MAILPVTPLMRLFGAAAIVKDIQWPCIIKVSAKNTALPIFGLASLISEELTWAATGSGTQFSQEVAFSSLPFAVCATAEKILLKLFLGSAKA